MKKYIFIFILSLTALTCWQCSDFIDVRPENASTYTNFFKTRQHAEALLTDMQIYVRSAISYANLVKNMGEIVDDDPQYLITNELDPIGRTWANFYTAIYQADLIIDNAHRFEISEEELKPYLLQAYFVKAVVYFELARVFGEAPITQGSTNFQKFPQSTVSEVLDEAEKWALKAMELPTYEEMVKTAGGERMKQYGSKGATAALLAHLYAWRAGLEGKKDCWGKAEEYCTMIIEGKVGRYSLAHDPEAVCLNTLRRNDDESIWELYNNPVESDIYIGWNDFTGFPVITTSYYDPTDFASQAMIYKTTVREMYPDGDLRRDAYFWRTDADSIYLKYINNKVVVATERGQDSVIIGYDNREILRAHFQKFRYPYYSVNDSDPEPEYMGLNQNKVIWRLADIYLLRAECRARQGKASAVDDLNKIRSRAYGDLDINAKIAEYGFPCANDMKNGLANNLQLAIFREREKELLSEGHRYYDIERNGWCFLRGEDSHDYIRKEISEAYSTLTDQDIEDGAMYVMLLSRCFRENDLIRQNKYWNRYDK